MGRLIRVPPSQGEEKGGGQFFMFLCSKSEEVIRCPILPGFSYLQ